MKIESSLYQVYAMKKTVALDIGDAWTGIAISDALGMVARPYTTVATNKLSHQISDILGKEQIGTIIVGYPKTMKGQESAQTIKVVAHKEALEKEFSQVRWLLQDERLSSKRASDLRIEQGKKTRTPEEKLKGHALAAAFILDAYLAGQAALRVFEQDHDDQE